MLYLLLKLNKAMMLEAHFQQNQLLEVKRCFSTIAIICKTFFFSCVFFILIIYCLDHFFKESLREHGEKKKKKSWLFFPRDPNFLSWDPKGDVMK